ncbi:hypothetical protein FRX31_008675 [Thalictrum thalictroides]|uniref:Uncharacterized protein n=1 Tax=Thalictrum thalictroides TaxID=46969 RepID=A0A7J6WYS9_THATH|nr:hypothetical protein FRX31_008675 [Thalictrum thalictroides]
MLHLGNQNESADIDTDMVLHGNKVEVFIRSSSLKFLAWFNVVGVCFQKNWGDIFLSQILWVGSGGDEKWESTPGAICHNKDVAEALRLKQAGYSTCDTVPYVICCEQSAGSCFVA